MPDDTHVADVNTESFVRRKKLRKGTQSCIECRRRKIRCSYPASTSSTCIPCASRGSRCMRQQDKIVQDTETESMTLRDRVYRLESIIDSLVPAASEDNRSDRESRPSAHVPGDTEQCTVGDSIDNRAPFLSVLHDAELLNATHITADGASEAVSGIIDTPASTFSQKSMSINIQDYGRNTPTNTTRKNLEVCERIRGALPSYDRIISTLRVNGTWFCHFHRKTNPFATVQSNSLAALAGQLYTSIDPIDLGLLATAYARSTGLDHHLYKLVEHLILSNPAYSHTIAGLECLSLVAKSYTDVGQPKKSWFLYRNGLNIAQFMGLYRQQDHSPRNALVWSCLYHADRFTSLLLGLPYGANDAHIAPLLISNTGDADFVPHQFTYRCAAIAGKLIDRDLTKTKASDSMTVNLDEQLNLMAASMPPEWWDIPTTLSGSEREIDKTRTRLQQHFYFFQLRNYVHLPFLKGSSSSDASHSSKLICIDSAREMLRRFVLYHAVVNGEKLFECKTADFIGFMAATVMLIGLSKVELAAKLATSAADADLVNAVKSIFRDTKQKGCHIGAQCYDALDLLSNDDRTLHSRPKSPVRIPIPYFGVVVRRGLKQTMGAKNADPNGFVPPTSDTVSNGLVVSTANSVGFGSSRGETTALPACDGTIPASDVMAWEIDELDNFSSFEFTAWDDQNTMDINNDWTLFMRDNDA